MRNIYRAGCVLFVAVLLMAQQPVTINGTAAVTQSGTWSFNLNQVAGSNLGATAIVNYGSTPAGVAVPAVNAFVTNVNANGQQAMAASAPVVIASNQSAVPVSGTVTANLGTTGDQCGDGTAKLYAIYDAATNGATQIVALSSGKIVYVCAYYVSSSSTTANTIKLVYGTGSNCATGQTAITPGRIVQAGTSTGPAGFTVADSRGLQTIASNELCVLTNAAQAAQVEVSYVQQ